MARQRMTHKTLEAKTELLNRLIPGADYNIDWAYGQPMLCNGTSHVSTRMRIGLLADWIDSYRMGIYAAQDAAKYGPTNGS